MSRAKYEISMDVLNQAQPEGRMFAPTNVASGIDILRTVSLLLIKQRPSVAEAILGIAMKAKFDILTDNKEQILFAHEESDFCQRLCCTSSRRFTLHVLNNSRQEIMQIHREFTCFSGCCWCAYCKGCRQEVTIEAPPGQPIGTVTQAGSCWRMHYVLKDIEERTTLTIVGPRCICDGAWCCCCKNKFTLFGTDGTTEIGAIHKKYSGYCKEAFTSADNYTYEVPLNLDVKMKAIVLAALFVIDFTNFSTVPNNDDN
ncbi:unnamed protein product [Rotaria magnacalcarata]|uniref:Phospholipid scramblase n=2 Tax=Rotaria magnacalcarata TaxID=392030 RepID=A0A816RRX6_9BILA|nr:unnamed protein product [Rotaria magnacalcarata]